MKCMKCGRDMQPGNAFCDACTEEMRKYPVTPGTVVHLPANKELTPVKKAMSRKKILSDQEKLRRLKRRLKHLWVALLIVVVLLIAECCFSLHLLAKSHRPLPGQNYSTVTSKAAETSASEPVSGN